MLIRVRNVEFFLTDCDTRLPFKFGQVTMTRAPYCVARARVETEDGAVVEGHAADLLVPKWFEKDATKTVTDDWFALLGSARSAANAFSESAAGEGTLGSINLAVDACNAVSLHSGLPISVVDLDAAVAPLRVGLAPPGSTYVFNASDQEIRVDGLLCLHDAEGPCANAVKDAQRTKTSAGTTRTLNLVWGTTAEPGRTERTVAWYRELLERAGATTADV